MPTVYFNYDRIYYLGTELGQLQEGQPLTISLRIGGGGTLSNTSATLRSASELPPPSDAETPATVTVAAALAARVINLTITPTGLNEATEAVLVRVRVRFDLGASPSQTGLPLAFTLPGAEHALGDLEVMNGDNAVRISGLDVSSTSASVDTTHFPFPSDQEGTNLAGATQAVISGGTTDVEIPVTVVPDTSFPDLEFMTVLINLVVNFPHGVPRDGGKSGSEAG